MSKLKVITLFFIFTIGSVIVVNTRGNKVLDSYPHQEVSITANQMSINSYRKILEIAADESNVALLNQRIVDDQLGWYCIGRLCGLNPDEHYSSFNDKTAKKVLPINTEQNLKVYDFSKLDSVYTKDNLFTVVGTDKAIKNLTKALGQAQITVKINQTEELTVKNRLPYIIVGSLVILYILAILSSRKKYVLNKYNGLYYEEEIKKIILRTLIAAICSSLLIGLLLLLYLNNNVLWLCIIPSILKVIAIISLIWIIIESSFCGYFRKFFIYQKIANSLSPISGVLLVLLLFVTSMLGAYYFSITANNYKQFRAQLEALSLGGLEDYSTYGLTMSGEFDFQYMSSVVDPKHVEFYKKTEDKYNGIVMDFQNYSFDYPVVNQNYLDYYKISANTDSTKINLLTTDEQTSVPPGVNKVIISNDEYQYIDIDTGLLASYQGPVYVIDSEAIEGIDDSLVSIALQANNYYLKLDGKQLEEIYKLINNLNLDQNITNIYKVSSISNNYRVYVANKLVSNVITMVAVVSMTFINLWLLINYRFEQKKQRFVLEFLFGKSFIKLLLSECMKLLMPMILAIVFIPNIYTITYMLVITTSVLIQCYKKYSVLIEDKVDIIKE